MTTHKLGMAPRKTPKLGSTADRFEKFHRANPHVLKDILVACDELWAANVRKASINMVFERLRWQHLITHGQNMKLNNSFRAYYARTVMVERPKMWTVGFFQVRKLQADSVGWSPNKQALGL